MAFYSYTISQFQLDSNYVRSLPLTQEVVSIAKLSKLSSFVPNMLVIFLYLTCFDSFRFNTLHYFCSFIL